MEVVMRKSAKVSFETHEMLSTISSAHGINISSLIDIAATLLANENLPSIKKYLDAVDHRRAELVIKKIKTAKDNEVAGCSYSKTGHKAREIQVTTFSARSES